MKTIVFTVFLFVTCLSFSQEEEFIPIDIEGKEAYMSTKTGEYTYLEHAKTDPTRLKTTASGVVYTDISNHTISKGETLSAIAKKNGVTISEIKKHNKVTSSNLKIGTTLKIVKKILIKSSSPVISYAGEERIIARLRPGETPGQFAAPPSVDAVESKVIETKKTEEKAAAKTYKVDDANIKNPVFGLGDGSETIDTDAIEGEIEGILEDVKEDAKKEVEIEEKKPSNQELTRAAKAEKLKQIRAEAKRLEAELEATPEVEIEEIETEIVVKEREAPKAFKPQEETAVTIEKPTESVAEKAARLVKSSKKTQAEMIAEKEKEKAAAIEAALKKDIEVEKEEEEEEEEEDSTIEYFHTVKKGESFYSIAKKYKMTTEALMALNKTKSANLDIGQKLKIKNPKL